MLKILFAAALFAQAPLTRVLAQNVFKKDDVVVFVGNSITQNGEFHHQVALFYATRFPQEKISVYNGGVGGNTSADVMRRMPYDILVHRPSWSVVKLGMNDVNRELYLPEKQKDPGLKTAKQRMFGIYKSNVKRVIDTLLSAHSRVILQTPGIYDQTSTMPAPNLKGRNDALGDYSKFIRRAGKAYGLQVIDYRTILTRLNKKLQAKDPAATIIGPDRVHPGPVGHFVMAYQFLKSTGAPKFVSRLSADARTLTGQAENADLTDLKGDRRNLTFTSAEKSLPFPVTAAVGPALRLVPFVRDFNQEILCVKNLEKGTYRLSIDGITIGSFTSDALSKGINLAQLPSTPQNRQAREVLRVSQDYWKTEADLRGIASMEYNQLRSREKLTPAAAATLYARLLKEPARDSVSYRTLVNLQASYLNLKAREPQLEQGLDSLRNEIYRANQPVRHTFSINAL
ncbi:SGNH/GDSL hydrolase family protein [Hufsiella ginkgonis]|uniref:SGNH hydrolase-type esterase domain-containing protein n=1 Tax=Hufsiella ginkgonis TaxID=2695274 RepID=A0A7K1XU40_9SPHI|nr:SGNH/GDSL hydrolase family protein [Hufsiella ginkgonis]MXV14504.1 hypothetical protein [Hufsiella ginkgonis]